MGRVGVLSGACTRGDELHECKSSCSSVTFVLGAVPEANEGASLSALTGARIHTAVSHASTHSAAAFLIEVYFCRAYTAWVTVSCL